MPSRRATRKLLVRWLITYSAFPNVAAIQCARVWMARHCAAGFGDGARCYADRKALIGDLRSALGEGLVCLIKGSRAMRMEDIAAALREG